MRICAVMKYPPIEGGVSARCYWIARALARRGHEVHVVTNAGEVEDDCRIWIAQQDQKLLDASFDNGGRVTVTSSGMQRRGVFHIPQSNPFASKLASLATEVIRRESCDVLFSYYYEPYGLSGHLASTWTDVPHVIQHAGSDQGRLINHPELSLAYREMLRRAAMVVTPNRSLEGLGIPQTRLARARVNFLPQDYFNADAPPMDADAVLADLASHPFVRSTSPWRADVPTLGVLGKVGELKGSYDLVAALARLSARGLAFNLLAMVAGPDRDRFLAAVDDAGLGDRTWTLPLLPHWRVPSFLRSCTAVCFLERRFSIQAHRPGIPQEIMACGICAVLSSEIADKQYFRDRLRTGENVLIVQDPSDLDELVATLESVVRDPARARAVGAAGASLIEADGEHELGMAYESLLQRAVEGHRGRRCATSVAVPDQAEPVDDVGVADAGAVLSRHAPATVRLMAGEIEKALEKEIAERPGSDSGMLHVAYRVIDRLVHDNAGDDADPRLDLARFERNLLWLAVDLEGPAGTPQFPRPPGGRALGPPRRRESMRPVRSNWLRISQHPANIERAISVVSRGAEPDIADLMGSDRVDYIFHKRGDLTRHVFRVNQATRHLIDLCDGSHTVTQIDSALAEHDIQSDGRTAEAVSRLAREGILYVW